MSLIVGALRRGSSVAAVFVLGSAMTLACNVQTTGEGAELAVHCGDENGNATCQAAHPSRPYCDLCRPLSDNQGCAASPPSVPACRPGGQATNFTTTGMDDDGDESSSGTFGGLDGTGDSTGSTSSTSGTTTGDGMDCVGQDGERDETCVGRDPAAPYCVRGVCLGCDEAGGVAFCDVSGSVTPACDGETGRCISCLEATETTCQGTTPVCGDTGACVGCTAHSQCPGTACHLDPADALRGACFGADEVVWVDGDQICPGQGTQAEPNCSLAQAVAAIPAGENRVIMLDAGTTPYTERVTLSQDAVVAIRGVGGPELQGQTGELAAALVVEAGTLYVSGVRVAGHASWHGVSCQNATLWLVDSEIRDNGRYGLFTTGPCQMVVRRSTIHHNGTGGVRVFGGRMRLDNSAIGLNGDGASGPGLNVQLGEVDILYSTVAGNDGVGADNVHCLDATGSIRNSVVVGQANDSVELDCFTLDFDYNAIDTVGFTGAEGALVTEPYNPAWFNNPAAGDFRLAFPGATPFGNAALWQEGDPPFDADGTTRPMGGVAGYAGVDEP